jgi:hypothetical protein
MTVPVRSRVDAESSPPTRDRHRHEGTASTEAAMTRSRSRRSEGRPAAVRVGGLFDHSPVISPRANRIGAIVNRSSRCRRARQVDFSAKTVSAVAGEFHHWPPVVVATRMTAAWGFRNAAVPLDRRVRVRVRAPVPGVRPCATKAPGRLRDVPRVRKPDLWERSVTHRRSRARSIAGPTQMSTAIWRHADELQESPRSSE